VARIQADTMFTVADPMFAMGPDMLAMPEAVQDVLVTGAPYSADAVTEMTQTLADGNRIARTVTASVSRDSEGRTRRDQRLAALGPWMPDAQPRTVIIEDPVAHASYMVDEEQKTAIKLPFMRQVKVSGPMSAPMVADEDTFFEASVMSSDAGVVAGESGKEVAHAGKPAVVAFSGTRTFATSMPDHMPDMRDMPPVERHDLGKQMIEGVEAVGTQSVTTIAAGAIGNEQPIRIVSERWYSEALHTVVMSKRSDPRTGEVVYRLTNLDRSEPSPALFQVPADYTVKDPMQQRERRVRTKAEP
jgi:hypothetical protein